MAKPQTQFQTKEVSDSPSSSLPPNESSRTSDVKHGWFLRMMRGPHAMIATILVAFCESSFFPLPPDIGIVSIVLHDRTKAWKIALWCTVASVLGGFLGYAIGAFLFDAIGHTIITLYGLESKFDSLRLDFVAYGFWIIIAKGVTPIPYKLLTISSGVFGLPLWEFAIASIIARASRFYILSTMLWYFGPIAKPYLERFFGYIMIGMIAIIALGFLIVKLVL